MAMGGDANDNETTAEAALFHRWRRLRERCTSELYGGELINLDSITRLREKLDLLEKELIAYQKEQDASGDQYWLKMPSLKMLAEIRETIEDFRFQLDSYDVDRCPEPVDTPNAPDEVQADVLDEETFIEFGLYDEVKLELPPDPSSKYGDLRPLRSTLQGNIMFGIDKETGHHVALKLSSKTAVFKQESLTGDRVIEDPINEMRLLEQLGNPGHRHVIRLLETLEDDENYWMALEFASGGELLDLIYQSGRLDEQTASKYYWQLIKALEYIHAQNICHLDLSPENILLTQDGDIKLTDFGLARVFDAIRPFAACHTTKPGKIGYMSPEIFAGREFFGPESDVYSSGVVLFIMLFGCPPYQIASLSDLRFRLLYCGEIRVLLRKWRLSASPLVLDLLSRIICESADRLSVQDILAHPWLEHHEAGTS
uniref:Protein kinase domain-containing protein n=1 Tax=Spongospora subterranea TaxID=70186 RepID=A0A0H5RN34_9EUKA|eukprot:CRZ10154.1 hypothetical protein [Spongospora subterranea]